MDLDDEVEAEVMVFFFLVLIGAESEVLASGAASSPPFDVFLARLSFRASLASCSASNDPSVPRFDMSMI